MKFAWVWVDLERKEKLNILEMKVWLERKRRNNQIRLAVLRNGETDSRNNQIVSQNDETILVTVFVVAWFCVLVFS
jgi:hypothetical protein